jgi:hypothetical protein
MDIAAYDKLSDLDAIARRWDELSEEQLTFVPSFSDLQEQLRVTGRKFRLLVAARDLSIVSLACFIYRDGIKRFTIAERKLFDLPVKEVSLFGSCVIGLADESVIQKFFNVILKEGNFDLINVGEVVVGSPLYNAVTKLQAGAFVRRATRKKSVRWLIRMPTTFDDYMMSLRPTTRKAVIRDGRLFQKQNPEFHTIRHPAAVEKFLRDGESISRLTYQWNVGERLCNDEATRRRMIQLAERGQFRGYLVYVNGKPCAFAWGETNQHGVFSYHTPGFDPQYRKVSPGTATLMWVIRDLIENTNCKLFDFGMGGDDLGYKSRFGNVSLECVWLQVGLWHRPYSVLIALLDHALNGVKNLANAIVGRSEFWQRLRKSLRQYGDANQGAK